MDPLEHEDIEEIDDVEQMTREINIINDFNHACRTGDAETVKRLLEQHKEIIDIDNCETVHEYPALFLSITTPQRNPEVVRQLLLAGANPNLLVTLGERFSTRKTRTIFQHLIYNNGDTALELVNMFLMHHADILAHDSDGVTALGIAAEQRYMGTIQAMLNHAMVNPPSPQYEQFYQLCNLIVNDNREGVKDLLTDIRDIDFNNMDEMTPTQFAEQLKKFDFVQMFNDLKDEDD